MPKQRKLKGGECGCNANHIIGPIKGGSGYVNPATFTSSSIPINSYYQYNQSHGTTTDPNMTGPGGNLSSAHNLENIVSGGKKRRNSKKNKKSRKMRGGNSDTKIYDYVSDRVPYSSTYSKGGNKAKKRNGKKSRKTKGGNLLYSVFNQSSNPINSFGTTIGAYNSASIATGNGQLGDSADYNQPAMQNSGYGYNNKYLI
jgi:hypothetical protein